MASLDEACLDLTNFVNNRTNSGIFTIYVNFYIVVILKRVRYLNKKKSCICRLPLLQVKFF